MGTTNWRTIGNALVVAVLVAGFALSPLGSGSAEAAFGKGQADQPKYGKLSGKISEASPPASIQELSQAFEDNQPQVTIVSPRANEVLSEDSVSVQLQVRDLALFKDEKLGLGPHLHVFLDNKPYQAVYDTRNPLVFENLEPGTHTIRAFASRPWHESFKNEGAYAQTTFHVFTKTDENSPDPNLPLLTYSRPQASYGAEPIMLDFYLTNAPLHLVAQEDAKDDIADWRIRATVNGNSFVLDRWQPIYLKGFKSGKNWVQLEFLDEKGEPVKNEFNNTARVITYEPNGKDTLARLTRGDLSAAKARGIVDQNYKPEPESASTPEATPTPEAKPTPIAPVPVPEPTPTPSPTPAPAEPTPEALPDLTPTPIPSELEAPTQPEPPQEALPQSNSETPPAKAPQAESKPGFFNRFRRSPAASPQPLPSPTPVETIESPQPEPIDSPQPEPETTEAPQAEPQSEPDQPARLEQPTPPASPTPKPNLLQRFGFSRPGASAPAAPTIEPEPSSAPVEIVPNVEPSSASPEEPTPASTPELEDDRLRVPEASVNSSD